MSNHTEIPHPENPEHIENLGSIPLLEAQGWVGTDKSLEISIFEYYFAWRVLENGDILCIFTNNPRGSKTLFHRTRVSPNQDLEKEYDWVDFEGFFKTLDTTREAWLENPMPLRIYDLYNQFGSDNIFGTETADGFPITEE